MILMGAHSEAEQEALERAVEDIYTQFTTAPSEQRAQIEGNDLAFYRNDFEHTVRFVIAGVVYEIEPGATVAIPDQFTYVIQRRGLNLTPVADPVIRLADKQLERKVKESGEQAKPAKRRRKAK